MRQIIVHADSPHRERGISLLECLITITLLAIATAIAIPHFEALQARQTIRQVTATLQGSFARMKIHAIDSGTEVILCGTQDKTHCQQNWSTGFMSFEDTNHNRIHDANERLLEYHAPLQRAQAGFALRSCSRRYFRTSDAGPLASVNGRIAIIPPSHLATLTQHLVVSRIGRTRIDTQVKGKSC